MNSTTRKAASVALAAVALVGLRTASAAGEELGLGGPEILVGDSRAEQCSSSAVQVDYDVAYVTELQGYGVEAARLSGLGEQCEGYDVVVTLSGPGGAPLGQASAVVAASDMEVALPTAVSAEQLTGVSVVLREGGPTV